MHKIRPTASGKTHPFNVITRCQGVLTATVNTFLELARKNARRIVVVVDGDDDVVVVGRTPFEDVFESLNIS